MRTAGLRSTVNTINDTSCSRSARSLVPGSGDPETPQGCASVAPAFVRHNDQLKKGNFGKLNPVILGLSRGAVWTEVPLLTDDFSKGMLCAERPSQNELLGACVFEILENQLDVSESLRPVEGQADDLASRSGCAPTRFMPSQSRFDRIAALFGRDRNRGATVDVQPILMIGKRVHLERHSNLALAHDHLPHSGMFERLNGEGFLIIRASDDVMTMLVHDAKLSRPE